MDTWKNCLFLSKGKKNVNGENTAEAEVEKRRCTLHSTPKRRRQLRRSFLTSDVPDLLRVLGPRSQPVGHDETHQAGRGERAADVAVELIRDGGMPPVSSLPGPALPQKGKGRGEGMRRLRPFKVLICGSGI